MLIDVKDALHGAGHEWKPGAQEFITCGDLRDTDETPNTIKQSTTEYGMEVDVPRKKEIDLPGVNIDVKGTAAGIITP